MRRRRGLLAAALAWSAGLPGVGHAARDAPSAGRAVPPPADPRLPEPGSYRLHRLFEAPDGPVLRSDGRRLRLHELLHGHLTVLSFMYTYCRDPAGCPLAWRAMDGLRVALQRDAGLARLTQLVSLSFDPSHDTPDVMRRFGGERAADPAVRWSFLTAPSVRELLPLLRGFGQEVSVEVDVQGRPTRTLNHMLKLFLVDERARVREVYSVATLGERVVLGDLKTLQMERAAQS